MRFIDQHDDIMFAVEDNREIIENVTAQQTHNIERAFLEERGGLAVKIHG